MKIDVTFSESDHKIPVSFGDSVQIGGGDNPLKYITQANRLFYKAVFPLGHKLTFENPNCPDNITDMFRIASGLEKLTVKIPTDKSYNAGYFVYDNTAHYSKLKELILPDGIKFSNFSNFANENQYLKTIEGAINLSESTSNSACFANCPELVDVSFVASTITKSISFAQSPKLSNASIASIVNGLATVTGQTLTLHATVKGKLTESQIATITQTKGWTLA